MDHAPKNILDEPVAIDGRDADPVNNAPSAGDFKRELLVEAAATFVVMFGSCLAVLMMSMQQTLTFPLVCALSGVTVAFVLCWLGPAHFNPAVTITFAVVRCFPWSKVPFYVVVQIGGSILACLALNGMMKPHEVHFYGTVPVGPVKLPFLMELIGSAVLMIVICVVSDGTISHRAAALAIGGAVGMLSLIIGPVSGGSMNPARSLGPAIVFKTYTSIWIYIVGPIVGMVLGALTNAFCTHFTRLTGFVCRKLKNVVG